MMPGAGSAADEEAIRDRKGPDGTTRTELPKNRRLQVDAPITHPLHSRPLTRRVLRSHGRRFAMITPRVSVPDLSRYACALSAHQGLVSRQRGGSTSVSLCDLVSLGTDESDPPRGTENPRVGGSIPSLTVNPATPVSNTILGPVFTPVVAVAA